MTKKQFLTHNNIMGIPSPEHSTPLQRCIKTAIIACFRVSIEQVSEHIHTLRVNMADITYSNVDNEVSDILNKCFVTSFRNGYIKANDVVLPVYFKKFGQRIQDMDIRDDDVWVCSYPKTGFGLFKYPVKNILHIIQFKNISNKTFFEKFN